MNMSKTARTVYTRRSLRSISVSKKNLSPEKPNKDSWMSENDSDYSELDENITDEKDNSYSNKSDVIKKSPLQHNNLKKEEKLQQSGSFHISFPKPSQNICILWYLLVLLVLLVLLASICVPSIFFMFHSDSSLEKANRRPKLSSSNIQSLQEPSVSEKLIIREIKEISSQFRHQSKNVWLNTVAALNSIVTDEPSQPAVLLLISSKSEEAKKTLSCLSLQLATATNKVFNTSTEMMTQVDGFIEFDRQEEIRAELDKKLKSILNQSFAVVVPQLQEIPPYAAMILHGYCDNFLAPFKKRVIILTAAFGSQMIETQPQVERYLRRLWDAEMGIDQSASLISRVANIPIFVKPEVEILPCL